MIDWCSCLLIIHESSITGLAAVHHPFPEHSISVLCHSLMSSVGKGSSPVLGKPTEQGTQETGARVCLDTKSPALQRTALSCS